MNATTRNIDVEKLQGWQALFWIYWGKRRYARNRMDSFWPAFLIYMDGLATVSIVCFYYLPVKYFCFLMMLSMNLLAVFYPVVKANVFPQAGWSHLLIGSLGLYWNWQFGLTLFHIHFEPYLFALYLIGGGLAVLRRGWNAFIWSLIDRIQKNYEQENSLSTEGGKN